MIAPLLILAALAPYSELEASAAHALAQQYERVGRSNPPVDPALTKAARALATIALDTTASQVAEQLTVTAALSEAGAWDATPRALVLRGSPRDEPLIALRKYSTLTEDPCSHLGIGAVRRGELAVLVVLFAERRLELAPFPRAFAKPPRAAQKLCARLYAPLKSAETFVTRPTGKVEKFSASIEAGAHCSLLDFPADGRHTVEVLGQGDRGPQVAALFFVQVGAPASRDGPIAEREPLTVEEARARVVLKINALRAASGEVALARDFELDTVAQKYAERLARENFFAHVAPDGTTLKARLEAAGYDHTVVGENLGLASGPLAAHFTIEHSPGHRKNLLDPAYRRVGIGVAKNSSALTLLVEVFANPSIARADEDPAVEAARAIAQARKVKGLPVLKRSAVLDQLATAHVKRALALNLPKAALPGEKLSDRVLAVHDDLDSVAIDFFVLESPSLVNDSKSLFDPRNNLVGIGVIKGDSVTYGNAKYWLVIIYGAEHE